VAYLFVGILHARLLRNLLLRVLVVFLGRPILVADLLILVIFLLFRLLVVLPMDAIN
jgi:hypothetical protein